MPGDGIVVREGAFDEEGVRPSRQPDDRLRGLGVAGVYEGAVPRLQAVGDALWVMFGGSPEYAKGGEAEGEGQS